MPNDDRSTERLMKRKRIAEEAGKAHPGDWGTLIRSGNGDPLCMMTYDTDIVTATHIALSDPDTTQQDIDEIIRLRGRVKRLDKEVDWLIEYIWNRDIFRCPMPEDHKCEQRYDILCCLDLSETEIRRRCWRYVANMATRINPGNSRKSREEETA